MKHRKLTQTALLTALICLISPWTVPLGALPVTLGSMAVCLSCTLGGYMGVVATAVYLMLGAVGVPVFAGFQGGLYTLLGPTAGFVAGYLPMAFAVTFLVRNARSFWQLVAAQLPAYALLYLSGATVYCVYADVDFVTAVVGSTLPFVITDILKIIFVAIITPRIKPHLK